MPTQDEQKPPADAGPLLSDELGPVARVVPYPYTPSVRLEWASTEAAHNARPGPLYDLAAMNSAADKAARIAKDAEAHYWQSLANRLEAEANAWERRYLELAQMVADGRAMQPAPAIVVDLGPNDRGEA